MRRSVLTKPAAAFALVTAAFGAQRPVSTADALREALTRASPGDTITAADGAYDCDYVTVTVKASRDRPVVVRARNRGKASLDACLTLRGASWVSVEGFLFVSSDKTALKLDGANNVRITRNTFRLRETESVKWVLVGGAASRDNRIDHNLFEEKRQLGNYITIDGDSEGSKQSSVHDRIDHNHFRRIGPRANNEMEAIRVGWSEISMSSGRTVVEYNLFEECDGDPEVVSVKSCDDTIRYNTFLKCQGSLVARHGDRSVFNGNFFLGRNKAGTGGIRVYGRDHRIYNNYFEGLNGTGYDAPLQLDGGDVESGALSSHWRVYRATVAYNTFVNNASGIEIGRNYSKPPVDCIIANNIVAGSSGVLIAELKPSVNTRWERTMVHPTGGASAGLSASGILVRDPGLALADGLWRLSAGSAAVGAAADCCPFVTDDMDGQERRDPDVGADEFGTGPALRRPLTPSDVGPGVEGDGGATTAVRLARVGGAVSVAGAPERRTVDGRRADPGGCLVIVNTTAAGRAGGYVRFGRTGVSAGPAVKGGRR